MDLLVAQSRPHVQWNPASLPFFASAAVSAWLVVLAWPRRNEPSAPPLISLVLFEGLWALCEAIEVVLVDPSAQAVIYGLKLSSVALVPPSLLFFVLEYTGRTGASPPRFKVLILAVPAISISLIATSGQHRLFLTGMELVEIGGYRLLSPRYGPAFWIHTSYCYALLCLSAWLLARSALALGGVLRKQMLFLSACLLIPLAINVADMLKIIPRPYREYDLTAATFVVTGVLGFVLLRRFQLINVAPVSYSLVVQEMLDAIIVLDARGRIAGVNRAALRLMGRLDKDIIGLPGDMIPGMAADPRAPLQPGRSRGAVVSPRSGLAGSSGRPTMSESLASRTAANRDGWSSSATSPPNRGRRRSGRPGSRPSRPIWPRTHSWPSWATSCGHRSRPCSRSSPPPSMSARFPRRCDPPRDRAEECPSRGAFDRRPARPELDIAGEAAPADGARRRARAPAPERGGLRRIPAGGQPHRPPRSLRDEQPDRRRSGPTPASLLELDHQRREKLARSQSTHDPHAEHPA